MIFWFFSASSEGPGTSVPALFPDSAFLAFLLDAVPAFPLQNQETGSQVLASPPGLWLDSGSLNAVAVIELCVLRGRTPMPGPDRVV